MILLEAVGAALLILGSFFVIRAVVIADRAASEADVERPEDNVVIDRRAA